MFRDHENNGSKATRDTMSNTPGREDRRNALERPVHSLGTSSSNTDPDNTSHDGVSGGYGHGEASRNSKIGRRANDRTSHTEHEHRRIVLEELEGDDLGADGIRDTRADEHGTGEFHD
jgi:hypothetical protein